MEWGLALNPNTPPAVPREILERLAKDPDESLAHNARYALERRAKGG